MNVIREQQCLVNPSAVDVEIAEWVADHPEVDPSYIAEIQSIFRKYVSSPPHVPRNFSFALNEEPVAVNGRIETPLERSLLNKCVVTADRNLNELATFYGKRGSFGIDAAIFTLRRIYEILSFNTAVNSNKTEILNGAALQMFAWSLQAVHDQSTSMLERSVLQYCLDEIQIADGQMESSAKTILPCSPLSVVNDISSNADFQEFLAGLSQEQIAGMKQEFAAPVGFVAGTLDAPVIHVRLENHKAHDCRRGMVIDWANVATLGSVFMLEGDSLDEGDALWRYQTIQRSEVIRSIDICDGMNRMLEAVPFGQEGAVLLQPRCSEALDAISVLDDDAAVCRDMPHPENLSEFVNYFMPHRSQSAVHHGMFGCVYPDLVNDHWEDHGVYSIGDIAGFLPEFVTLVLRSHIALDNTMRAIDEAGQDVGYMAIGLAHYRTLRAYAAERGINVIFYSELPAPPLL